MKRTLLTTLLFGLTMILNFLVTGYVMSFGLTLLNQPSTLSVVSGVIVSLVGFVMFIYIGSTLVTSFFSKGDEIKTEKNNSTNKTEGVTEDGK